MYGKLDWRYASDNDTSYNIKVDGDKIRPVTSEGGIEKKPKPLNL